MVENSNKNNIYFNSSHFANLLTKMDSAQIKHLKIYLQQYFLNFKLFCYNFKTSVYKFNYFSH